MFCPLNDWDQLLSQRNKRGGELIAQRNSQIATADHKRFSGFKGRFQPLIVSTGKQIVIRSPESTGTDLAISVHVGQHRADKCHDLHIREHIAQTKVFRQSLKCLISCRIILYFHGGFEAGQRFGAFGIEVTFYNTQHPFNRRDPRSLITRNRTLQINTQISKLFLSIAGKNFGKKVFKIIGCFVGGTCTDFCYLETGPDFSNSLFSTGNTRHHWGQGLHPLDLIRDFK